jgi:hypothetical protein
LSPNDLTTRSTTMAGSLTAGNGMRAGQKSIA